MAQTEGDEWAIQPDLAWLRGPEVMAHLDVASDSGPGWEWLEDEETDDGGTRRVAGILAKLHVPVYVGHGVRYTTATADQGRLVNRIGVVWDDVPTLLAKVPELGPAVRSSPHWDGRQGV